VGSQTAAEEEVIYTDAWVGKRSWNGRERNQLLLNLGGTRFAEVGAALGVDGLKDGRGLAAADFDLDGDVDFAINNYAAAADLWENRFGARRAWLALRLQGAGANRDAVGAIVRVHAGGRIQTRLVGVGHGYASQYSLEQLVGLGDSQRVERVVVTWPTLGRGLAGRVESFGPFATRKRLTLVEGQGRAPLRSELHPSDLPPREEEDLTLTVLLALLGLGALGLAARKH
jgi:hypothetical protein